MNSLIKLGLLIGFFIAMIALGAFIQQQLGGTPLPNDELKNHLWPFINAVIRGTET